MAKTIQNTVKTDPKHDEDTLPQSQQDILKAERDAEIAAELVAKIARFSVYPQSNQPIGAGNTAKQEAEQCTSLFRGNGAVISRGVKSTKEPTDCRLWLVLVDDAEHEAILTELGGIADYSDGNGGHLIQSKKNEPDIDVTALFTAFSAAKTEEAFVAAMDAVCPCLKTGDNAETLFARRNWNDRVKPFVDCLCRSQNAIMLVPVRASVWGTTPKTGINARQGGTRSAVAAMPVIVRRERGTGLAKLMAKPQ